MIALLWDHRPEMSTSGGATLAGGGEHGPDGLLGRDGELAALSGGGRRDRCQAWLRLARGTWG